MFGFQMCPVRTPLGVLGGPPIFLVGYTEQDADDGSPPPDYYVVPVHEDGDLLVLELVVPETSSPPIVSGWNRVNGAVRSSILAGDGEASTPTGAYLYWRIADSEPANYARVDGAAGVMAAFRNAKMGPGLAVSAPSGAGTSVTAPAATTEVAGEVVLFGCVDCESSNTKPTLGAGPAAICGQVAYDVEGYLASGALAYFRSEGVGSSGTQDFTTPNQYRAAYSQRLLPSSVTSIEIVGVTSAGTSPSGGTSVTIAPASGLQDGDLMLAFILHSKRDTGDWSGVPSGWTELVDEHDVGGAFGSTSPALSVYWKFASSESGSYQWTLDATDVIVGTIVTLRGVDQTTPIDATATTAQGTSGAPDPASITTATNGALVVVCGFSDDGETAGAGVLGSPGYTHLEYGTQSDSGAGNGLAYAIACAVRAVAGSENPGACSSGVAEDWGAVTIAVRAAA